MKKKQGFTLIELLVVISIIALLVAILMPALSKAKMQAKTAVCTVNCKSLTMAWSTYANDNEDAIVSSFTGYSTFGNHLSTNPDVCANPWIGWAGYQSDTPTNEERQTEAIKQGKLYPYLNTPEVYHCPASKKYELRCYSIPDILDSEGMQGHVTLGGLSVITKSTQIKSPGSRISFLDEGYASFGGFTLYQAQPKWWDLPPVRHDNGVTLGFVDGHAEFYKWQDERTIETAATKNVSSAQEDNSDLKMMQRGMFGSIGY